METRCRWLMTLIVLLAAPLARADDPGAGTVQTQSRKLSYEDRIAELERTVEVLADELERTRMDVTVPEEPELKSEYGLGPAASKVYGLLRGLSIGGYGEAYYRNFITNQTTQVDASTGAVSTTNERDEADFLRAVLYVGYKFTDSIVFNSEMELEHTDEISLEFATLDFLWRDYANLKTGLMLVPMGWLNELHEPPFFYGVNRPDTERFIIPTTWREDGVGLFGSLGELFHYKLYVLNGLDAEGFSTAGIRGGRQNGGEALAEDLAFAGRFDFTPTEDLILGASVWVGNSGQNQNAEAGPLPESLTTLFDVHAQYQARGLHLRGLFSMLFLDDAGQLTRTLDPTASYAIASQMLGGYAEAAYDVWQWFGSEDRRLEPFYRFEYYDTQWKVPGGFSRDGTQRVFSHTVGLQFKPIPQVVIKGDYRNRNPKHGKIANEINVGIGYVF
jgi:hypothetical protein